MLFLSNKANVRIYTMETVCVLGIRCTTHEQTSCSVLQLGTSYTRIYPHRFGTCTPSVPVWMDFPFLFEQLKSFHSLSKEIFIFYYYCCPNVYSFIRSNLCALNRWGQSKNLVLRSEAETILCWYTIKYNPLAVGRKKHINNN